LNVLIAYAHPEPKSFNAAMKDVAVEALRKVGHDVVVSDLYALRFKAVVGAEDFRGERAEPASLSIAAEQTRASETGTLAADIVAEQDKLRRADLVILQFPVWRYGMPAILKGWADRVFARGFAYAAGRNYDRGMFRGKTAMVAATTGTSADTYAPDGIDGNILSVLWPVHNGLLRYCGFDVLSPLRRLHAGPCRASRPRGLSRRLPEAAAETRRDPETFLSSGRGLRPKRTAEARRDCAIGYAAQCPGQGRTGAHMSTYVVVMESIKDQETFVAYRKDVPATVAAHGGRFIVRGGAPSVIEDEWPLPRLVIIEFPTRKAAEDWYHSADYQKLLPLRLKSSVGNMVTVDSP
jgi:NAD(P)H dehydrogenase (quinone)